MIARSAALASVALFAVAFAGCGSSSSPASTTSASTSTTSANGGAGGATASGGASNGGAGGATSAGGGGGAATGGAGGGGGAAIAPALWLVDVSNPTDLTPDGSRALLQDFESAKGDVYVYDVATKALDKRGDASNPDPANGDPNVGTPLPPQPALGLSADASRIVGTHGAPLAMAIFEKGAWKDLAPPAGFSPCPGDPSNLDDKGSAAAGWDLTADGHTLVGMAWNGCGHSEAVRFDEAKGAAVALEFAGVKYARATKVADDGSLVGGFVDSASVDRSPALWDAAGHVTKLDPPGTAVGEVLAIAPDGSAAAGSWNDANGNAGFVWTKAGGVEKLPPLADAMPADQVFANAVTAGGVLVFGGAGDWNGLGNTMRAFVWKRAGGTIAKLGDVAAAHGLVLPENVVLASVIAASADGSVLLGTTLDLDPKLPFPKQRSFVLRLPTSAY
jgi:hypothetical protein